MSRRRSDAGTTRSPRFKANGTGSDIPQYSAEVNSATNSPEGNDEWVIDTASGTVNGNGDRIITAGETFELPARSLLLLRR